MCRFLSFLLLVPLVACQSQPRITTADAAKKAAWQICDGDWGELLRSNGGDVLPFDPKNWHAKLDGDHWHVWVGPENAQGTWVDVPVDGHHPPAGRGCKVLQQD